MSTSVEQILEDVSLHLFEPSVNTTQTTFLVTPGTKTIAVANGASIYNGALLIIGFGTNRAEVITVSSFDGTSTFTATIVNNHISGDVVLGATFPLGQTDHPLFNQAEMIQYVADVQNDFLLKTRPIYAAGTVALNPGQYSGYAAPADSIRVEFAAVNGSQLFQTSQDNADMNDADWPSQTGVQSPRAFYLDKMNVQKIGFTPPPQGSDTVTLWYSQSASTSLTLTSSLLVPDVMAHYIKYGVLAVAWSKDGEMRDNQRADYCQRRFDLGVQLVRKFMEGTETEVANPQSKAAGF